jgi:hypothetical protein
MAVSLEAVAPPLLIVASRQEIHFSFISLRILSKLHLFLCLAGIIPLSRLVTNWNAPRNKQIILLYRGKIDVSGVCVSNVAM